MKPFTIHKKKRASFGISLNIQVLCFVYLGREPACRQAGRTLSLSRKCPIEHFRTRSRLPVFLAPPCRQSRRGGLHHQQDKGRIGSGGSRFARCVLSEAPVYIATDPDIDISSTQT